MPPLLNEEETALDPYVVLALDPAASEGDIKKAYRKMSLKYHPDKNSTPEGAIMFRKVTVSLDILTDQAKRKYIDTRLESDRRRKEQYAARDKRKQGLVDALVAREEEAKRAKLDQAQRRKEASEEESIKEAGRKMLEEAQKRQQAAAAMAATAKDRAVREESKSVKGAKGNETKPAITPIDLSLVLTIPAAVPTHNLRLKLETNYGPISHLIMREQPVDTIDTTSGDSNGAGASGGEKKKKPKSRRAVVEFEKGNWGGCWACWKDHQKAGSSLLGDGIRAKWAVGDTPAWVGWAADQPTGPSPPPVQPSTTRPDTAQTFDFTPSINVAATAAPTFTSAPDFGGTTMADLLKNHAAGVEKKEKKKKQADEFESMTLLRMRQMERERLEAEIRAEEEE